MHLRQTVALLRRDRKIPISALTQSTAESADRCGECESALNEGILKNFIEQTLTKIKFKKYYFRKFFHNFALSFSNTGVQPINK